MSDQKESAQKALGLESCNLIHNEDYSLFVPNDKFYTDKKLPELTFSQAQKSYPREIIGNEYSSIWRGEINYIDLCDIVEKSGIDIVVDIGAFAGMLPVSLSKRLTNASYIYCFEPNKDLLPYIALNSYINNLHSVNILPFAISDEDGVVSFSVSKDASISGRINTNKNIKDSTCPVYRIDSILGHIKNSRILMKVDVEGFEPNVLQGAKEFFSSNQVDILIMEYWPLKWRSKVYVDLLSSLFKEYLVMASGAWQFMSLNENSSKVYSIEEVNDWMSGAHKTFCDLIFYKP